ncbi:MAG: hypothetical protein Q8Q58_14310 [Candidatus Rokubacteria bacterium]|nr:hypothetical protein [Candidatus Rokubacteria bacterium]
MSVWPMIGLEAGATPTERMVLPCACVMARDTPGTPLDVHRARG